MTDSETGVVTTYYYDLLNRQSGYQEKGGNVSHTVKYEYDEDNNIASLTEMVNGITKTYSYTYDEDNRIISETVDGVTVTYTYDGFGRMETRIVKQNETVIQTSTPTYAAGKEAGSTSGHISTYNGYTYTYDSNGNILSVSDGTNTTSYVYDSANQLVRENNQALGFTHTWTYDAAGNILSRTEYAYTTADDLSEITATDTVSYSYGDTDWKDLLTSYDGNTITYDAIGNPLTDGEWTYTWQNGRELVSLTNGTMTWNYNYGSDGMRIKRTNGTDTYTYVYNGSRLAAMTKGSDTLQFTYDVSETPLAVIYNGVPYYYHTNVQGDILGIRDVSGNTVVTYAYDAWGKLLSTTGTMVDSLGAVNPLRYRGYVYDSETELYYLQSRYYNPEWGRFVSEDEQLNSCLLGKNFFTYCNNNPIMYFDSDGRRTYIINGINNTNGNEAPGYSTILKQKLIDAGVENVITIGIYNSKGGALGIIQGVCEVAMEMLNIDIYTADVVKDIEEDLKQHPLAEGEELNLIGYSGGGQIAYNVAEKLDVEVSNIILIGAPAAEIINTKATVSRIYGGWDPLSWSIGWGFKSYFAGWIGHTDYFNSKNIGKVVGIIASIIKGG